MRRVRVSGRLASWTRYRIAYRFWLSSSSKSAFAFGLASSAASELRRRLDLARAVIRGGPAPVRLRTLDLGEPRRPHPSPLDERRGAVAVDLRPPAPQPPRREALEEVVPVERLPLAVDPAVAERDLQRLRDADRPLAGGLLGDLEPDPLLVPVVSVQPSLPGFLAREGLDGRVSGHPMIFPASARHIR